MPVVFCDVVGSEGQNKAFSKKRKKAALESKSNQSEAHKVVGPVKYVMPAYVKCIVFFSNKGADCIPHSFHHQQLNYNCNSHTLFCSKGNNYRGGNKG